MPLAISAADVRAASGRIRPLAKRTPVMTSERFDAEAGVRTYFKCENLQKGGAFKIRGAANLIFSLPAETLARGVVAFSSGNHAQAVAIAARHAGTPAVIVMPGDAPKAKLESTRANGAEVIIYDRFRESREQVATRVQKERDATLVPPFDHPMIMAGQGTAALELLEEVPELDALIAPVSGGGLLSGCTVIAREMRPSIRIFGAEPEDGNDTFLSLIAGERIAVGQPGTIADGLRVTRPGELTFPILREHRARILLVSDEEMKEAMRFLASRLKLVVEPSGAAAAAAVLARKLPADITSVGVILSGGNVDMDQFGAILAESPALRPAAGQP
jgi:threonine dehydratase